MSNITTTLYQYLVNNYGQLDWKLGSVIRELVAAPVADLAEQANANINNIYNNLNITNLLANPEGNKDAIDELFSGLGLSVPTTTKSTGTVKILLNTGDEVILSSGATFSYNDVTLNVTDSYKLTPLALEDGDLELKQVGYEAYEAIIPVESAADGVSLGEGTELSWAGLPVEVYSATVYSPVTGGVGTYTATQKLNRIRQLLFPVGVGCPESILRAINGYAANTAADCWLGTNNSLGIANVYVKPVAIPQLSTIALTGVQTVGATYQAQIPGTGIEAILSVEGADSFSYKRYNRTLVITYSGANTNTTAQVLTSPTLVTAQTALDNYLRNTGIVLNVLAPNSLYLEMYLPVQVTGSTALSEICAAVNNSALNATAIGDNTVRPILRRAGVTLPGVGTYTLKSMTTGASYGNQAVINPSGFASGDIPYAVYTTLDRITTNG